MKQHHFKISKYSKIMSYQGFIYLDELCQMNQTLPEAAKIPTSKYFTGKSPSNLLTSVCVKTLQWLGHHAERINTTGMPRKINGEYKFTFGGGTKGSADIHSVLQGGKFLALEIKINDQQSDKQKAYEDKIQKVGGMYNIIRKYDELLELLE